MTAATFLKVTAVFCCISESEIIFSCYAVCNTYRRQH